MRRFTFFLCTDSWRQTECTVGRRDPFNHGSLQSASHRRPRQKLAVSRVSRCAQRAARGQKVSAIRHVSSSAFSVLHEHFPYRNSERWVGVWSLSVIRRDLSSGRPSLGARQQKNTPNETNVDWRRANAAANKWRWEIKRALLLKARLQTNVSGACVDFSTAVQVSISYCCS